MPKPKLRIVVRSIDSLQSATRNPRTHSKKQIRKIADSIMQFGFVTPILIGPDDRIVAGHGRLEAAKLLGSDKVPTLQLNLPPAELRAYAIADNELAAQAGWDRELLAIELAEIQLLMPEIDLTVTGFDLEDIKILQTWLPRRALTRPPMTASYLPDLQSQSRVISGSLGKAACCAATHSAPRTTIF